MPKFSEDALLGFTKPPSDDEENKLSNAEKRKAKEFGNTKTVLSSLRRRLRLIAL